MILSKDLEDIVINYKKDLEAYDKYRKCLNEIENMKYTIKKDIKYPNFEYTISIRFQKNKIVRYTIDTTFMNKSLEFSDLGTNYLEYTNNHGTFICNGNEYFVDYWGENIFKVYEYLNYTIDETIEDFDDMDYY